MKVARILLAMTLPVLAGIGTADAAPAAASAGPATAARVHVIQRGDSLFNIARRYNVTVAGLVQANRLSRASAKLKIGTRLAIPAAAARAPAAPRTLAAARSATDRPERAQGKTRAPAVRRVSATGPLTVPASLVLSVPDFAVSGPPFLWPIDGWVSSSFGQRRRGWHRGIDIMAAPGTTIIAAAGGLVVASGWEGRYGRVVKIAHEDGFTTVYAHNERNLVEVGEWVVAGQPIGTVGRTGRATAEHVHFEIRHDGRSYNPLYLLPEPPRIVQAPETEPGEDDEDE